MDVFIAYPICQMFFNQFVNIFAYLHKHPTMMITISLLYTIFYCSVLILQVYH